MACFFCVIMLLCMLGGIREREAQIEEGKQNLYYVMVNLLLSSLLALIYTNDLFTAYVFVEINTISACGLIMIRQTGRTFEAAARYMIMSLLGSGLLLLGICHLYAVTGHGQPQPHVDIADLGHRGIGDHPPQVPLSYSAYRPHDHPGDAEDEQHVDHPALPDHLESHHPVEYLNQQEDIPLYMGLGLATEAGSIASLYHVLSHGATKSLLFVAAAGLADQYQIQQNEAHQRRRFGGLLPEADHPASFSAPTAHPGQPHGLPGIDPNHRLHEIYGIQYGTDCQGDDRGDGRVSFAAGNSLPMSGCWAGQMRN